MNKVILLILILLHFASSIFSQKNLQPGYLVLNNNDTLKGFINYREWIQTPHAIQFTPEKNTPLKGYTENEISYFEVSEIEAYKRFHVNISLDNATDNMLTAKDTATKTDTVFLKILYSGTTASLLSYADKIKVRYYLLLAATTAPQELKNSIYLWDGKIINEKEYQPALAALARTLQPQNAALLSLITKAGYNKQALLQILYQLNGLANAPEPTRRSKKPVRFFAGAGIQRGLLQFGGSNPYTRAGASRTYVPVFIIGADIFANPNVGKLFFKNTLSFTRYKSQFTVLDEVYSIKYYHHYRITQNNLSVQTQLSYNLYNQPLLKWFIGAGGGFNFSSYPQNNETFERYSTTETFVQSKDNFLDLKKYWMNISAKTGVTLKNMEAVLFYSPKVNLADNYASFGLDFSSLQLQVLYRFSTKGK